MVQKEFLHFNMVKFTYPMTSLHFWVNDYQFKILKIACGMSIKMYSKLYVLISETGNFNEVGKKRKKSNFYFWSVIPISNC